MKRYLGSLCCGVLVLGALLSGCAGPKAREPRQITVIGVAVVEVPPDFVTVEGSVVTLQPEPQKAQAENDARVKAVLSLARGLGIASQDIRTQYTSLDLKERREQDKPPVTLGYEASKSISVVLRDMTKYDELLAGMLKVGVNRISGITFGSTQEIAKRREARLAAVKAAREKAEYLAAATGQKVGKPLWIREATGDRSFLSIGNTEPEIGNVPIPYFWAGDAKPDSAQGTLAPGSQTIRVGVEACFALMD